MHCWGGFGRTGIVIGAWLIRRGRAAPETFVEVISSLRGHLPSDYASPVTEEQIESVRAYARR